LLKNKKFREKTINFAKKQEIMRKNKKFIEKFRGINNISFLDIFPLNIWSRGFFLSIHFISVNFFFSGLRARRPGAPAPPKTAGDRFGSRMLAACHR
jgi:hypothetical protein